MSEPLEINILCQYRIKLHRQFLDQDVCFIFFYKNRSGLNPVFSSSERNIAIEYLATVRTLGCANGLGFIPQAGLTKDSA